MMPRSIRMKSVVHVLTVSLQRDTVTAVEMSFESDSSMSRLILDLGLLLSLSLGGRS